MRAVAMTVITLMLATPALAVELFRYRGAAKDGGTLEYVFETDQADVPNKATKEKGGRDRGGLYDDVCEGNSSERYVWFEPSDVCKSFAHSLRPLTAGIQKN
jgi:hypothetical protein